MDQFLSVQQFWIDADDKLSVVRQCRLASISRSMIYANKKTVVDKDELVLLRLLDEKYTRHHFYGSRKMTVWLLWCLVTIPAKNTHSIRFILICSEALILFDLTRLECGYNLCAVEPHGFVYLVAIIDWYIC